MKQLTFSPATCLRKKPYKKRKEAARVMQAMISSPYHKSTRKALNVYRCEVCKHFHVGHKTQIVV